MDTFIAKGPDATSSDLTAMTPPLPAGGQYGDLFLVIAVQGPTIGSLACTSPGWTQAFNIGWSQNHRIAGWWARQLTAAPGLPTITKKAVGPSIASVFLFRGISFSATPLDAGSAIALTNATAGSVINTAGITIQDPLGGYVLNIAEVGKQTVPPAFSFSGTIVFTKLGADSVFQGGANYIGYSAGGGFSAAGNTGPQKITVNFTLSSTYPASALLVALTPAPRVSLSGSVDGAAILGPLDLIVASDLVGSVTGGSQFSGDISQIAHLEAAADGSSSADAENLIVASDLTGVVIGFAAASASLITAAWSLSGDTGGSAAVGGSLRTAGQFTGNSPGASGPIPPAKLTTSPSYSDLYGFIITMRDASATITMTEGSNVYL